MSLWHLKLHPDALEIPISLYRCPQDTKSPQVPIESCTSPHPKPVSDALKTTNLIWLTPTPSRGPQVPRVPPDALKTTENPMCPQNAEPRSADPKPHHPPPHSQTPPHVPPHPPPAHPTAHPVPHSPTAGPWHSTAARCLREVGASSATSATPCCGPANRWAAVGHCESLWGAVELYGVPWALWGSVSL